MDQVLQKEEFVPDLYVMNIKMQDEKFLFSLDKRNEAICRSEKNISAMFIREVLHDFNRLMFLVPQYHFGQGQNLNQELKNIGSRLYSIIPSEIKQNLTSLPIENLLISSNMGIPLEIIHDDDTFFGCKYSMGNIYSDESDRLSAVANRFVHESPFWEKPRCAVMGGQIGYLPGAMDEIERVSHDFVANSECIVVFPVNYEKFGKILKDDYHIMHFVGHGKLGDIELDDHRRFRLSDMQNLAFSNKPLFFANACHSGASTHSRRMGVSFDLSQSFIMHGGACWVGAAFPVNDIGSRDFAELFYKNLFEKNYTVGEALRNSRIQLQIEGRLLEGVSYFLHGNPAMRIITP
jgi:CHAT domain-containing protein